MSRKVVKECLAANCKADPLLPRPNPIIAFWQEPVHPKVASIQSATLRETTDIIVIGSGITSCSVTKTILESPSFSGQKVTVLEARTLTSGATGRNGGHLMSAAGHDYSDLEAGLGKKSACEVARFSLKCVERVREVVQDMGDELKKACELRDVVSVAALEDEASLQNTKISLTKFETDLPDYKGYYKLIEGMQAAEEYGFQNTLGVVTARSAALWPYRLVTGIFSGLLDQYPGRLSIETSTPVTNVSHDPSAATSCAYTVTTPRGLIRASTVIYCTNGHTSHLLPNLRGKIFPMRGTMSTQKAGPSFPNLGATRSWTTHQAPSLDPKTGNFKTGLIYITQNEHTGDVFIGGELQSYDQILVSDDTVIPDIPAQNLATILPKIFKGWDNTEPVAKRIWSGIMGFTADAVPLVGLLPEDVTGRAGTGEWIAAGFNGYGMDKCWLSGEALVGLMTGDEKAVPLPKAYTLSQERLGEGMKRNFWVEMISGIAHE